MQNIGKNRTFKPRLVESVICADTHRHTHTNTMQLKKNKKDTYELIQSGFQVMVLNEKNQSAKYIEQERKK